MSLVAQQQQQFGPPALDWLAPLTWVGRDPAKGLVLTRPLLLAPMQGVTDEGYRDLVIACGGVGAASTDFVRLVAGHRVGIAVLRRELGRPREDACIGIQLMTPGCDGVAETAAACERAGSRFVDLNFGCPAPKVVGGCAGSALLAFPERVHAIVASAVQATGLPVTAKLRVGLTDGSRLAENLVACAEAGAAGITLHARRRCDSYAAKPDWRWLAEARNALDAAGHRSLPLVGNGGIRGAADAQQVVRDCRVQGLMIGTGALADPWVFARIAGAPAPDAVAARGFLSAYVAGLWGRKGPKVASAALKHLLRHWTAGGLVRDAAHRLALLRAQGLAALLAALDLTPTPPSPTNVA